jgi:hypothetical protein
VPPPRCSASTRWFSHLALAKTPVPRPARGSNPDKAGSAVFLIYQRPGEFRTSVARAGGEKRNDYSTIGVSNGWAELSR